MPIAFPLTASSFWDLLPIKRISFDAPESVVVNRFGNGSVQSADMGPILWQGQVELGRLLRSEVAQIEVLVDLLRPAGRLFHAYDTRYRGPASDPAGTILGAANPVIASLPTARELSLSGLPANYVLRRGDYLAFTYSGRRALHRIVDGQVTASAGGVTPAFEVYPPVRPGATPGTAVSLVKASCLARIIPGSTTKGSTLSSYSDGFGFSFIQSLGAA